MSLTRLLNRRRALYWGLGAIAGLGTTLGAKAAFKNYQIQSQVKTLDNPNRKFDVKGTGSLRDRAIAKGMMYGSAILRKEIEGDSDRDLRAKYIQECNVIVPGWELKWSAGTSRFRPTPDAFDFKDADWLVQFAQDHQMLVRGHTLIWHLCLPGWFESTVNRDNARHFLVNHIETTVKHYAGKMHSWDVVNEVIEPQDGRSDNLRKSPWLEFLGPDYIDLAFRVAAKSDPNAMLVLNEYGLEYDTPEQDARRAAVLDLLKQLKSKGTPVHAFGMQSHLMGHETRFNTDKLRKFLSDVADLGLKILITELDVNDQELPAEVEARDRIIATAYEDYLSVVLDVPAVIGIITWGLSDRYTWLSEFAPRKDNIPVRPLPFDQNLKPKLAWNVLTRIFDKASVRE